MPTNPAFEKSIIHLDMDAFYASVEILDDPSLAGLPVIVGGTAERGVVCAASYEARKYGVFSALSIALAKKRCPQGIFLPPRMERYQEVSRAIMAIFKRYTPLVEPISLDEAFLDVTGSQSLFGSAIDIAKQIKMMILAETGLTVSAGVANCKLLAKIASDMDKPDGLTIVPPGKGESFLAPLPIAKLWGVGKSTINKLELLGVKKIGDLTKLPIELLTRKFGSHGTHLHMAARAIDNRKVEPTREIKSIGHEDTFAIDIIEIETIEARLLELSVRVAERARRNYVKGKTVSIKVKYYDFVQISRSVTLNNPIDDDLALYREGLQLLRKTAVGKKPIRLLGIYLSGLTSAGCPRQETLFNCNRKGRAETLNKAIDLINEKYAKDSRERQIKPARLIKEKGSISNS